MVESRGIGHFREMSVGFLFAHGIPQLVFLLEEVLTCYCGTEPLLKNDLSEIVRVAGLVLTLCKTASRWKADPETDRPIKRPILNPIWPYLRSMKTAFWEELQELRLEASRQKEQAALQRQREKEAEQLRRKRQKFERERDEHLDRVQAELDAEERQMRQLRRRGNTPSIPWTSSAPSQQHDDIASAGTLPTDSDTSVERVEMFKPRAPHHLSPNNRKWQRGTQHSSHENGQYLETPPSSSSWTEEERLCLMIGLQKYTRT